MSLGAAFDAFSGLSEIVSSSATSFLDDLVDAFDDEEVLGASKVNVKGTIEPPFVDLQDSRGLIMKFDLKGPEDAPKLLYIPGSTDDLRKTMSNAHCEAFAQSFRTLTCDLRNQGQTMPFCLDRYVSLEEYVEDLIALVNKAFSPDTAFHVVGWSFGGALALMMCRLHPGRVRSAVVLSGGYWDQQKEFIGSLSGSELLFREDWHWIKTLSSYASLGTEERCEQMLYHADTRREDVAFREKMRPTFDWHLDNFVRSEDCTVTKSPRSAKELGDGVMAMAIALFAEGTSRVEDILTPTIIVHGRHDGMHSVERAFTLKRKMKSAMLVVLEDEGHVIVTAAVEMATSFMQPPRYVHPCLQKMQTMTYECAHSALEEVSATYMKEGFQKKLDEVFEQFGMTDEEREAACHQICLQMQGPILDKYGLPGNPSESFGAGASDPPMSPRGVFDWMRRGLAALEKMAVVDRTKCLEKEIAESRKNVALEERLLSQQEENLRLDPEDYMRRALQMSTRLKVPVQHKETTPPLIGPDGDYIRRAVQMRQSQRNGYAKEMQSKQSVAELSSNDLQGYLNLPGSNSMDPEDYIRRSLQMRSTQQKQNSQGHFSLIGGW